MGDGLTDAQFEEAVREAVTASLEQLAIHLFGQAVLADGRGDAELARLLRRTGEVVERIPGEA